MTVKNGSCGCAQFQHSRLELIALGITSGASVIICAVALILVLALRLYRIFVYRLSVYQVLGAIGNGIFLTMDLAFEKYYGKGPASLDRLCLATAYLTQFSLLVKLFFTIWLTFHLFCFAVYHKNMKKLEAVYVATSIGIPAAVAAIPFFTHTYGLAKGWCWIMNINDTICPPVPIKAGIIEQFALWYGPVFTAFVIESGAMVVLMVTLGCRAYRENGEGRGARSSEPLLRHSIYRKALNQMLPLVIYPFVFGVLIIPPLVNRILDAAEGEESLIRCKMDVVFIPLLFLAAGVTLTVHVCFLLASKKSHQPTPLGDTGMETANIGSTRCSTYYVPPVEDSGYGSRRVQ